MSDVLVDGFPIPEAAILAEMQHHPADSVTSAREAAVQALVVRQLLRRAAGLDFTLAPDSEGDAESIGRHLETVLALPLADEASCRRYYERNKAKFRSPDLVEARHILLAAAPDDLEGREKARQRGADLLVELLASTDRFAELAIAHSDCPSKKSGGHLGQLVRGSTVPEFETYLFSLERGELCRLPIESRYGVHLLQCLDRVEGRQLEFAAVHEKVVSYLQESAWRRAVSQYISLLAGGSTIVGASLRAARDPLLQ